MGSIKAKYFSGVRRRWMINSLSGSLMIVVVSLAAFSVVISNYYYGTVRVALESRARQTAGFFDRYYNSDYESYYASAYRWAAEFKDRDKLELQFINASGRLEITTAGPNTGINPQTPDIRQSIETAQLVSWVGDDPLSGERVMSVSAPLLFSGSQVIGVMRYITSMQQVDTQVIQLMGLALLVGLVFIVFVTASNLVFIRGILRPVKQINDIARRISEGRYGIQIENAYDGEIGELINTLNHMSTEISAAERMKTDFISSVSHELRTPLTAINGWGETLLSPDFNDPVELKKGVGIMLRETVRLTKMVEELLDFTRMEGGRLTLTLAETDVRAELEEIVYMYMDALRREGIRLSLDAEDDVPAILGDRERLKQVFLNVMDNAVKHGGDGKQIDVSLRTEDGAIVIEVTDHGQGIPPEELPHVKYKFYKGKSKTRGSGIGLAVSDEIIRLHDGTLELSSELGQGTRVTIRLPLAGRPSVSEAGREDL